MVDDDDDFDEVDYGCPNCDGGVVMICIDDLCRGAGYCINNMNDSTCWADCPHCSEPVKAKEKNHD